MRNEDRLHEADLDALFNAAEIRFVDGTMIVDNFCKEEAPPPDPRYIPVYTKEDVDKIVMMLTLWIPDMDTRTKLEEIYQCWKDTQKN